MNSSEESSNRLRWRELIDGHLLGRISGEESRELESLLAAHSLAREDFRLACNVEAALRQFATMEAGRELVAEPRQNAAPRSRWRSWQPLVGAAAAGILFGLSCSSMVWAMSSPRLVAMAELVPELADGGFESMSGRVSRGFPKEVGVWSGDESEVVESETAKASMGRRVLRFVRPESDAAAQGGRAISCDVFQLVDLRTMRARVAAGNEAVLELSADFRDARPPNSKPSVTFFCQMFLFQGDPHAMHVSWPLNHHDALGSGSAQMTTLGDQGGWCSLSTGCLLPENADFAVIQLAARPNLRPAELTTLFADNVMLTLKTQPVLPVRRAERN